MAGQGNLLSWPDRRLQRPTRACNQRSTGKPQPKADGFQARIAHSGAIQIGLSMLPCESPVDEAAASAVLARDRDAPGLIIELAFWIDSAHQTGSPP